MNRHEDYDGHVEQDIKSDASNEEPPIVKTNLFVPNPVCKGKERISRNKDSQLVDNFMNVHEGRIIRSLASDIGGHVNGACYLK